MRPIRHRAISIATGIAVAICFTPSGPVRATTGWLDPAFGGGGWVRFPAGDGGHVDLSLSIGPSGEVIVARGGFGIVEASVLTRDGAPVEAFGGGGWQTIPRVVGTAYLIGVFATPSGGVVGVQAPHLEPLMELGELASVGSVVRTERAHLPLDRPVTVRVRLPGAALEAERGLEDVVRTGRVVLYPQGSFTANAIRFPDGSIRTCYADLGSDERRLFGLTPTFAADRTVGPSGHGAVPIAACEAVAAHSDGHVYLAGTVDRFAESKIELIRITASGVVDGTWNDDGRATVRRSGLAVDFPMESVRGMKAFSHASSPIVAMPDGSIFIAASVSRRPAGGRQAALIKLTPDGALDSVFGDGGLRILGPEGGQSRILAMAVDQSGRAVVSAILNDEDRHVTRGYLARLTATGDFDPSFGDGGLIEQIHVPSALAIDAQGRILTAAWAGRTNGVFVARRTG